jgi:hypothetical protein
MMLTINFLFYSPNLMLADLDFSIYINGVVLGSAFTGSFIFSYLIITRLGRKTISLITFSIIFVLSFILIFVWSPKTDGEAQSGGSSAFNLVAFFIITFMIVT